MVRVGGSNLAATVSTPDRPILRLAALAAAGVAAVGLVAWSSEPSEPTTSVEVGAPAANLSPTAADDPVTADPAAAQAILDALADNGVLTQLQAESTAAGEVATGGPTAGQGLLPVVHTVHCEPEACEQVADWARTNGLQPSAIIEDLEHGGVPWYRVEVQEYVPATATALSEQARTVMEAVASIDGATYQEWMTAWPTIEGSEQ